MPPKYTKFVLKKHLCRPNVCKKPKTEKILCHGCDEEFFVSCFCNSMEMVDQIKAILESNMHFPFLCYNCQKSLKHNLRTKNTPTTQKVSATSFGSGVNLSCNDSNNSKLSSSVDEYASASHVNTENASEMERNKIQNDDFQNKLQNITDFITKLTPLMDNISSLHDNFNKIDFSLKLDTLTQIASKASDDILKAAKSEDTKADTNKIMEKIALIDEYLNKQNYDTPNNLLFGINIDGNTSTHSNKTQRSLPIEERRRSILTKQSADEDSLDIIRRSELMTWETLDILNGKIDKQTEQLKKMEASIETINENSMGIVTSNVVGSGGNVIGTKKKKQKRNKNKKKQHRNNTSSADRLESTRSTEEDVANDSQSTQELQERLVNLVSSHISIDTNVSLAPNHNELMEVKAAENNVDEAWIPVQQRKRIQNRRNLGTNRDNFGKSIYLSNINKKITKEMVIDRLEKQGFDKKVFQVIPLIKKNADVESLSYISFKLSTTDQYYDTFMNPSIWPKHTHIDEFKPKTKSADVASNFGSRDNIQQNSSSILNR